MSSLISNNDVLARLKPFGISFEKSLSDLIKGIRHHSKISPESLSQFLDSAIEECRQELNTTDLETKAMAILKLTYLEMYGFDMSWSNFKILEIMSSSKFQQKRVGYLAAIQSFKNEQDLLILATNQFKKDLNSGNPFEVGLALSGIATIVTPNLAKDINDDVLLKLTHSKPYVRKKAILAMYKIFLQYPDSLRANFERVVQILDDPDNSVVSATINVICEISKKSPTVFVNYLPKFFTILEESKNNWLIIRILKLFQSLSRVEPRMKKKILPTLINLMVTTQASSLIYECINCIVSGNMLNSESSKDRDVAKLCIEQILKFFETKDSNLKFVGLLALINILKQFPTLLHKIKGVSTTMMACLTDEDIIIKSKALEIAHYLIDEDNITEVVKILLIQLIPSNNEVIPEHYKLDVVLKILSVSNQDNYINVPNMNWYVAVLKDMINLTLLPLPNSQTTTPSISNESIQIISVAIGNEFKTLATKIPSIRSRILKSVILEFVQDIKVLNNCPILLKDFYWIMGEYIDELKISDNNLSDDEEENDSNHPPIFDLGKKIQVFNAFVNKYIDVELHISNSSDFLFPLSNSIAKISSNQVLCVLIQALVKVFNSIFTDYVTLYAQDFKIKHDKYLELQFFLWKLINFLSNWENHQHYEVQERTLSWLDFLKLSLEAMTNGDETELQRLKNDEIEFFRKKKLVHAPKEDDEEEEDDEDEDDEDDDDTSDEQSENETSPESETEEDEQPGVTNMDGSQSYSQELTSNPFLVEDSLPALLTHVLPSFFKAYSLNPVALDAQKNIPLPDDIDLETQLNDVNYGDFSEDQISDTDSLFNENEIGSNEEPLIQLNSVEDVGKKQARIERLKDDPYYITSSSSDKRKDKAKTKKLIQIDEPESGASNSDLLSLDSVKPKKVKPRKIKKEKVLILAEENVSTSNRPESQSSFIPTPIKTENNVNKKKKKNFLKIDSSNLENFDVNASMESPLGDGEYEVDLDELRKKLEVVKLKDKPKKKKKKNEVSTDKSQSSKKKKKKITTSTESDHPTVNELQRSEADKTPVDQDVKYATSGSKTGTPESVIEVKKSNKKKKKKAVII